MKPILTVCAEAAEAAQANAATAAILNRFMSPPKRTRILNEPCAAERTRQRNGVAGSGPAHRKPYIGATLDEGLRMTAGKRVPRQRRGRWCALEQISALAA